MILNEFFSSFSRVVRPRRIGNLQPLRPEQFKVIVLGTLSLTAINLHSVQELQFRYFRYYQLPRSLDADAFQYRIVSKLQILEIGQFLQFADRTPLKVSKKIVDNDPSTLHEI